VLHEESIGVQRDQSKWNEINSKEIKKFKKDAHTANPKRSGKSNI